MFLLTLVIQDLHYLFLEPIGLFVILGDDFIFKFIQLFLTWTETIDDTSGIVFIINVALIEAIKYILIDTVSCSY